MIKFKYFNGEITKETPIFTTDPIAQEKLIELGYNPVDKIQDNNIYIVQDRYIYKYNNVEAVSSMSFVDWKDCTYYHPSTKNKKDASILGVTKENFLYGLLLKQTESMATEVGAVANNLLFYAQKMNELYKQDDNKYLEFSYKLNSLRYVLPRSVRLALRIYNLHENKVSLVDNDFYWDNNISTISDIVLFRNHTEAIKSLKYGIAKNPVDEEVYKILYTQGITINRSIK